MLSQNLFDPIFKEHFVWSLGILYKDVVPVGNTKIYLSNIPGPYFNFAVVEGINLSSLDLEKIQEVFKNANNKASFVLTKEQQEAGFIEHLLNTGYKFEGTDCWVIHDNLKQGDSNNLNFGVEIEEIDHESFSDYFSVLSKVFDEFPGNNVYLEMCLKTLKGELPSKYKDLQSLFFVIKENGQSVAGGGLFYSKKANIAYLHDGGTLKEHRGKGYQSFLLQHRTKIALEAGVNRIYSSVELGSQSWTNCLKNGFTNTHPLMILAEK